MLQLFRITIFQYLKTTVIGLIKYNPQYLVGATLTFISWRRSDVIKSKYASQIFLKKLF